MGDILALPTDQRSQKDRQWERGRGMNRETDLQGLTPVILPYSSFDIRPDRVEETDMRNAAPPSDRTTPRMPQAFSAKNYSPQSQVPLDSNHLEVETTMLNTTFSSIDESGSQRPKVNYIKRYRNEEEKLLDMLHERDATLKSALKQGMQLRAKCNRYKDELESVRSMQGVELTENQWKKKYLEMDKKYRDANEELDILAARNKNGRDFLEQQKGTIDVLNLELQREKLQKQQVMSQSMSSLRSVGVTDKKGKMAIMQLQIDNKMLDERVNDLLVRNQRGRDYLARVEKENRDLTALVAKLKAQNQQEKADKEHLLAKLSGLNVNVKNDRFGDNEGYEGTQLYAQVQKKKLHSDENHNTQHDDFHKAASPGGFADYQETKFEMDDEDNEGEVENPYRVATASYEEINFSNGMAKMTKDEDEEEEFVIEAIIEPENGDSSTTSDIVEGLNLKGVGDTHDKDETDSGTSPTYEPYQPKSTFADDVITRF